MFTLGDGADSCSLMHGALSVRFRGKEPEAGECLALLITEEGMGYLKAVNNQGTMSD